MLIKASIREYKPRRMVLLTETISKLIEMYNSLNIKYKGSVKKFPKFNRGNVRELLETITQHNKNIEVQSFTFNRTYPNDSRVVKVYVSKYYNTNNQDLIILLTNNDKNDSCEMEIITGDERHTYDVGEVNMMVGFNLED